MKKEIIRCSSLGRIFQCPFSMKLPQYDTSTSYATQGTKEHERAERFLKGENITDMSLNTLMYCDFVNKLKTSSDEYYIEKRFNCDIGDDFTLSGCPDFYAIQEKKAWIVDLKTGYMEVDPRSSHQLKGYALLLSKIYRHVTLFCLSIVQDSNIKTVEIPKEDILFFEKELAIKLGDTTHATGDHCLFCPSKIHCKLQYDLVDAIKKDDYEEYYYEIVKNKTILKKTIDEIDDNLRLRSPNLYEQYTKSYKKWIDETDAPYKKTLMRPTEAIRQDKKYKDNVYAVEKVYWRLKKIKP